MLCCQFAIFSPLIIFSPIYFYKIEKTGPNALQLKAFRPVINITCAPVAEISNALSSGLSYHSLSQQFFIRNHHFFSIKLVKINKKILVYKIPVYKYGIFLKIWINCLQYLHNLDTYNSYNRFQKVKTFYSHPIIRWVVRATRQEEPSRALLVF